MRSTAHDIEARRVSRIEAAIDEFERMSAALAREIGAEEARTKNADPAHYAYSTFATATRKRRDNLVRSIEGLRAQVAQVAA